VPVRHDRIVSAPKAVDRSPIMIDRLAPGYRESGCEVAVEEFE